MFQFDVILECRCFPHVLETTAQLFQKPEWVSFTVRYPMQMIDNNTIRYHEKFHCN